jgi:glycosyltransferase involved in cell wall biosynthesis
LGHQVEIFALHPDYESLEQTDIPDRGVRVRYVAPMHVHKSGGIKTYYPAGSLIKLSAQATWHLAGAAISSQADLLVVCKPHPMNSLAGWFARLFKGKILCLDCDDYEAASGHFEGNWQKWGVALFERQFPLFSNAITTNTHFMEQKLASWGVEAAKIHYLPNGVELDRFQPPRPEVIEALRLSLGLQKKKVVSFIGSMGLASHSIDLLIEAFVQVHAQESNAVLLMVGGGEDYERLQKMAGALGLSQVIRFVGWQPSDQVVEYYTLSDVAVDPVRDTDAARGRSPLKLFESWACGVPFITADVGDRRTLAGSPPAAWLTCSTQPEELSAAILLLLNDPEKAQTLRQRGFQRVQEFSWDRLAKTAEQIYLSTLSKPHKVKG